MNSNAQVQNIVESPMSAISFSKMGKRKSTRKVAKKEKTVLDKTFGCVFCNHEDTVSTKFDQENKIGHLSCSACGVQWSCAITGRRY